MVPPNYDDVGMCLGKLLSHNSELIVYFVSNTVSMQ